MRRPKMPKMPRKPSRPPKPKKTYMHTEEMYIELEGEITIGQLLQNIKNYLKKNNFSEDYLMENVTIFQSEDYFGCCGGCSPYSKVKFYLTTEKENSNYKRDVVSYEKKLKKFNSKMKEYKEKMEEYDELLAEWKLTQTNKEIERKNKELLKLEKELKKLKGKA